MAITPLPTPPRRDHPESFADDGDVFLGALPTFGAELNALADEINAASSDALAQAEAALAAVNCPAWVSGTTYSVGQCVYSPVTHYSYRRKVSGAGTTDPSADATNWQQLNSGTLIPSGTAMLFAQTNAPTGWTKSTTHNNKALRVVSGAAGSGGSLAFTSAFSSRTPTGSITVDQTTLTEAQMPAHTHSVAYNGSWAAGGSGTNLARDGSGTTGSKGGGGSHNHTGTFSGSAMDFSVQYVDVIIATKD